MNNEKVIVSKNLIDEIAKLLMQAGSVTDNLSLADMATAAELLLPAQWELVTDTILQEDITDFRRRIENAEEVHIEVTKDTPIAPNATTNVLYAKLWGSDLIVQNALSPSVKCIVIHGQKLGDDVIMNYGLLSNFNAFNYSATRIGAYISEKAQNNNIGFYTSSANSTVKFTSGTRIRIWAKRRSTSNEQSIN